jgi:hypothetical protein
LTQSLLDDPAQIDTVFADAAGYADLLRDGRFSAGDEYAVAGATADVTKTAVVISDPMNGIVAPKAIPGAVVEYCIAVKNIGAAAADRRRRHRQHPGQYDLSGQQHLCRRQRPPRRLPAGRGAGDGRHRVQRNTDRRQHRQHRRGATTTTRFRVTLN